MLNDATPLDANDVDQRIAGQVVIRRFGRGNLCAIQCQVHPTHLGVHNDVIAIGKGTFGIETKLRELPEEQSGGRLERLGLVGYRGIVLDVVGRLVSIDRLVDETSVEEQLEVLQHGLFVRLGRGDLARLASLRQTG
nr:hypothetical protein [Mycolicibacterium porcinum]